MAQAEKIRRRRESVARGSRWSPSSGPTASRPASCPDGGGHLGLDPAVHGRDGIEASLNAAGFEVDEVLDAPDRPGLEWFFVARRP